MRFYKRFLWQLRNRAWVPQYYGSKIVWLARTDILPYKGFPRRGGAAFKARQQGYE